MTKFACYFSNLLMFVARLSQCVKHECVLAVESVSLCYFLGKLRKKNADRGSSVISYKELIALSDCSIFHLLSLSLCGSKRPEGKVPVHLLPVCL